MTRAQEILKMCEQGGFLKSHIYKPVAGKYVHPIAQLRKATPGYGAALTGVGAVRGGMAVHRLMRAQKDKIRQVGLGNEYDTEKRNLKVVKAQAKQDYKEGNIDRKGHKAAIENQRAKIDDISAKGMEKHKKMMQGLTSVQRQAINPMDPG